jgi:hypothetical protein
VQYTFQHISLIVSKPRALRILKKTYLPTHTHIQKEKKKNKYSSIHTRQGIVLRMRTVSIALVELWQPSNKGARRYKCIMLYKVVTGAATADENKEKTEKKY